MKAKALHGQAFADQPTGLGGQRRVVKAQGLAEKLSQATGVAWLCNEIDSTQGARVAGITLVALAGKNDDLHVGRQRQQVSNKGKSLVGPVRKGRQAKVDQGKWW